MIVEKFKIEVGGKPVRLYINSKTKARCFEPDGKYFDTFSKREAAEKKAALWVLKDFTIVPYSTDIGTPTNLSEIAACGL